jgi:uncharacterized membrane protein YfcA
VNILSGFSDISIAQLLLVTCVALFASVVGGLAGYGTGALMPLVLVPLVGAEPVVQSSRSPRSSPTAAVSPPICVMPIFGARESWSRRLR